MPDHDENSATADMMNAMPSASHKSNPAEHVDTINPNVVEKTHLDGTVDLLDVRAVGGQVEEMPTGYFYSIHFIGTVVVSTNHNILPISLYKSGLTNKTPGCLSRKHLCVLELGHAGKYSVRLSLPIPPAPSPACHRLICCERTLINEAIGPSKNINWVATSWTLGNGISYLLFGRLSDIFGRRWMTIGANVLTLIACIVASTASRVDALIAANTLNGFAAAVQLSFPILLGELVSNKHRGPIAAAVFLVVSPFSIFGPAFARLFIINTAAGWRWNFYLGIIFSAITVILLFFFYHPPKYAQLHVHGKTPWQQFKDLDHGGLFLLVAGMVLFLIGLSWGGQAYPWASARVVATIVTGGLCLVAFGFYGMLLSVFVSTLY